MHDIVLYLLNSIFKTNEQLHKLSGIHDIIIRGVDLALWHHSWCQSNFSGVRHEISGARAW